MTTATKITTTLNLINRGDSVYTGLVNLSTTTLWGATKLVTVGFRVDGREGSYRVDINPCPRLGTPWEAIDGGEGFRTLAAARRFVRNWLKASKEQNSAEPRDVARPFEKPARVTRAMVLAAA